MGSNKKTVDCDIPLDYFEQENVKLAYLNGIHLEERLLFDRNMCYNFLVMENIIDESERKNENEEHML